jgi:hypothetical protein
MLRVHLGPFQGVDNDIGGIDRELGSLCGGFQPVVLISPTSARTRGDHVG